jgi:hypothetical protein
MATPTGVGQSGSYPNRSSASCSERPRATAIVVHDRPARRARCTLDLKRSSATLESRFAKTILLIVSSHSSDARATGQRYFRHRSARSVRLPPPVGRSDHGGSMGRSGHGQRRSGKRRLVSREHPRPPSLGLMTHWASGCWSPLETTKGSSEHHVIGSRMVGGLRWTVVPARRCSSVRSLTGGRKPE